MRTVGEIVASVLNRLCYFGDCPRQAKRWCEAENCTRRGCIEHMERCEYCHAYFCSDHWEDHAKTCQPPACVRMYPSEAERGWK